MKQWCNCRITDALNSEIDRLKSELEQTRVQLAGCGVAAMCNTRESMQEQLVEKGAYGYSASYQDVVDAVNREISLREQLTASQQEVERLTIQRDFAQNELNDVITTRFEASKATAREIVEILDEEIQYVPEWKNAGKIEDEVITNIKQRYGLEG